MCREYAKIYSGVGIFLVITTRPVLSRFIFARNDRVCQCTMGKRFSWLTSSSRPTRERERGRERERERDRILDVHGAVVR